MLFILVLLFVVECWYCCSFFSQVVMVGVWSEFLMLSNNSITLHSTNIPNTHKQMTHHASSSSSCFFIVPKNMFCFVQRNSRKYIHLLSPSSSHPKPKKTYFRPAIILSLQFFSPFLVLCLYLDKWRERLAIAWCNVNRGISTPSQK